MDKMSLLFDSSSKVASFIVIILFGILFTTCQSEENAIIVEFIETEKISGQPVEYITTFSSGNVHLTVADTFLVIQKNDVPFFKIYNTNTHELLAEFGEEGRDPEEFLGPVLQKRVEFSSENESPVIKVFDYRRQSLSSINIFHVLSGKDAIHQEDLSVSTYQIYFHHSSDSTFIGTPLDGRFQIYNHVTQSDTVIPYVPKTDFNIPEYSLSAVYRTAAVINRKENLMAAAPLYFGQLDFFDLNGNYLRSTMWESKNKFEEELRSGQADCEKIKTQIVDLDSKSGLIYGLNRNNSVSDYNSASLSSEMIVQVFNWDGDPLIEYVLDKRKLLNFAIDSVNNRIYAYSPNEPEHNIIMYDMNQEKN